MAWFKNGADEDFYELHRHKLSWRAPVQRLSVLCEWHPRGCRHVRGPRRGYPWIHRQA